MEITHHHARINGITMHYAAAGAGPLVILAHGFPHSWYSWRHQMAALSAAGFTAIAPDLRGMGETSAPADPRDYDVFQTAGDMIGLLDHLGAQDAVFAGLDFGLFALYDMARIAPARMRAIIGLANPAWPHDPHTPPLVEAAQIASRHFYHIDYFARPGLAEAALDAAPREFLTRVFYALSADYHYIDVWQHPPGTGYLDALPQAPPLPWRWLSEAEMEVFVQTYARSGFRGGLNWYRAMDIRWHQRQGWIDTPCRVPFFFIASVQDTDLEAFHGQDPLAQLPRQYSDLRQVAMISGAGHMMQMERADEVSRLMLGFLRAL